MAAEALRQDEPKHVLACLGPAGCIAGPITISYVFIMTALKQLLENRGAK